MPGPPLSSPPACNAAAWNACTAVSCGARKQKCSPEFGSAGTGDSVGEIHKADLVPPIAQQGRAVPQTCVAERRQRGVVEALGPRDVAYPDRDMVEHWISPDGLPYNRLES